MCKMARREKGKVLGSEASGNAESVYLMPRL